jgi:hypothetical protein
LTSLRAERREMAADVKQIRRLIEGVVAKQFPDIVRDEPDEPHVHRPSHTKELAPAAKSGT